MAEQAATGLRAVSARGSRLGLAVGSAFLLQLILAACNAPGVSRASSSPDSTHDPGQVDCPAGKPARSGLQNFGAYIGTWDANHEHDPQVPAEYAIGSIPGRVEVRCSNDGYVVVERIRPQLQSPAGQALRVGLTDLPDDAEKVYDHTHAGCRVLHAAVGHPAALDFELVERHFRIRWRQAIDHSDEIERVDTQTDDVERWSSVRRRLLAARCERPQPGRDDKVVAAWNGLAITALVEWAALSESRPEEAIRAGELLAQRHLVAGRLRRVSRDGVVGDPAGVLEDYGCVAEAFCALHQATGEGRWLDLAGALLDTALAHFGDGTGGFYDTADDAERLVTRPADPTDNATPSGLSSIVAALTAYGALTGHTRYREAAAARPCSAGPTRSRSPRRHRLPPTTRWCGRPGGWPRPVP